MSRAKFCALFIVVFLAFNRSPYAHELALDAEARSYQFTPLSPIVFKEITQIVVKAQFGDLLVKAQAKWGLRDLEGLRDFIGTCNLPAHENGLLIVQHRALTVPRFLPERSMNWADFHSNQNLMSDGQKISATHSIFLPGNHHFVSRPGYAVFLFQMPRVCLNPSVALKKSALTLIHELTHFVYRRPVSEFYYLQYANHSHFVSDLVSGPGGESKAFYNELIAAKNLAVGPMPEYASHWRNLYAISRMKPPVQVAGGDPYPIPDELSLVPGLTAMYSQQLYGQFVEGLVHEINLVIDRMNTISDVNRYWIESGSEAQRRARVSDYMAHLIRHHTELQNDLASIKEKYKPYIQVKTKN